ncbi:hypothetical protein ASC59_12155 [Leifsonia sp. Root1293]|nr:hypothetical protein ASC59_12155 [Leifsonia sp. Root1293]KRA08620.1 hypothetical protein ASD61_12155 [Leifsonia sp. Root60]
MWLPGVIVPVVIGVGVFAVPLTAGASVDLPDKTAAEVLELAQNAEVTAFSGTIEQSSDLGLPDLSSLGGVGGASSGPAGSAASGTDVSSALELLTGSHTARVFVDGTDARLQVMDSLAERDVVATPDGVWIYDSEAASATHAPAPTGGFDAKQAPDAADIPTPSAVADELLAKLDPSTTVSVGTDATVAGRTVYELILTPRSSDTLVGSVSIDVDSATGLPIGVAVTAAGSDAPAFSLAFSELSLDAPDAALFDFTPPAGTTVTEQPLPDPDAFADRGDVGTPEHDGAEPTVLGTGWSSIVEIAASEVPTELADSPLLDTAAEPVDGGRVISTTLLSVLFTDDGRILAGAVSPAALEDAAAGR